MLAERTGRTSSPGAVYVALGRLEKKGLVASRLGDPSPRPGGRPKRCYSVEKEGVESLLQAREEWSAMMRGFEGMLERAP